MQALSHPKLAPPPRPAHFTDGAAAELRDAMARFASTAEHAERRSVLVDFVDTIDLVEVAQVAAAVTAEHLDGTDVDVAAASWTVPTYTLATVFGMANQREQLRSDAEQLALTIGRNHPPTEQTNAAATRLMTVFAEHADPVVPVSLLYQNHDASSQLMRSAVLAAYTNAAPPGAGRTARVATSNVTVGTATVQPGQLVAIDLDGMPFGAGPHRCPGQELANSLVAGVLRAFNDTGYYVDQHSSDANGYPTRLIMKAPQ